MTDTTKASGVAFLWDNIGPMHADRIDAVARHFGGSAICFGFQEWSSSTEYQWLPEGHATFISKTLFPDLSISFLEKVKLLICAARASNATDWFLCNYERAHIAMFAFWLRFTGRRVFVMGCAKFDDRPRSAWRELLKSFYLSAYCGAIGSGKRSKEYFAFLGVRNVVGEYNTLSLERVRAAARTPIAPDGAPHGSRHFTIVARFIAKKNICTALDAYAYYAAGRTDPHPLHLCGSGELEEELRTQVRRLGLGDLVTFTGFLQRDGIARELSRTLALILPSTEEQFGNVVIEAQAMGVPVIVSTACGARDLLVRNQVNGFVVEPDNVIGFANCMAQVSEDEDLWRRFSLETSKTAELGDDRRFAEAVALLISKEIAANVGN